LKNSGHGLARIVHFLDALAWQGFERTFTGQVEALVVFTERDRRVLTRSVSSVPIVCIPIATCISARAFNPLGSSPPSLLLVGNFIHPPNVDAALRLGQRIFPAVRKKFPDASLYLVGDQPPPEIRRLSGSGIFVTGLVPEIMPFLDQAAVVVAPLRLGGGMRVKVLEALAAGKALVASPLAVEGLDIENGMQAAIVDADEDFQHAICRLLAHSDERSLMAHRARQWALDHLVWEKSLAAYETLYRDLISKGTLDPIPYHVSSCHE
jgi:glycosyltransferase involved in cell wall biosynthesis